MKRIAILGSTGSIGRQALSVIRQFPGEFEVIGLAAGRNWQLMAEQVREFSPRVVALREKEDIEQLSGNLFPAVAMPELFGGDTGLHDVATHPEVDIVLTAVPGIIGLIPTIGAIKAGKDIALANKETLVTAGLLVTEMAKQYKVQILPVDSEHSAIWQCMNGISHNQIAKIILTASGGPFYRKPSDLSGVSVEMALNHPNWKMGRKVTVDSATMMNKGLEIIEARWLFGVQYDQIRVVIHPQSIIHSMVELVDGSTLAQLGVPDMRMPIQYALTYPSRRACDLPRINWNSVVDLTFQPPDTKRFRCLALAQDACLAGGTMPVVLNAANEVAVEAFLSGMIGFNMIAEIISRVMDKHQPMEYTEIEDVLAADSWARELTRQTINAITRRT